MIEIVPSILVINENEFISEFKQSQIFKNIDVDLCVKPFVDKDSLGLHEILSLLKNEKRFVGFHLMEQDPEESIEKILRSDLNIDVIFVHQESNLSFLNKKELKNIGISIKIETLLRDLSFYQNFKSVQLMTGTFGAQGKFFDEDSIAKSIELREMGFEGVIGVDGGVNLRSAKVIKDYPINRVSVGSFFKNSKNLILDNMKLDLALNLNTQ